MIEAGTPLTVTSAGTPQPLSAPESPLQKVHAILIQALPTNTGKIWIGNKALKKGASPPTGVISVLAVPTTNIIPSFSAAITLAAGGINVSDFWIDADNTGEGVVFSVLIT